MSEHAELSSSACSSILKPKHYVRMGGRGILALNRSSARSTALLKGPRLYTRPVSVSERNSSPRSRRAWAADSPRDISLSFPDALIVRLLLALCCRVFAVPVIGIAAGGFRWFRGRERHLASPLLQVTCQVAERIPKTTSHPRRKNGPGLPTLTDSSLTTRLG